MGSVSTVQTLYFSPFCKQGVEPRPFPCLEGHRGPVARVGGPSEKAKQAGLEQGRREEAARAEKKMMSQMSWLKPESEATSLCTELSASQALGKVWCHHWCWDVWCFLPLHPQEPTGLPRVTSSRVSCASMGRETASTSTEESA